MPAFPVRRPLLCAALALGATFLIATPALATHGPGDHRAGGDGVMSCAQADLPGTAACLQKTHPHPTKTTKPPYPTKTTTPYPTRTTTPPYTTTTTETTTETTTDTTTTTGETTTSTTTTPAGPTTTTSAPAAATTTAATRPGGELPDTGFGNSWLVWVGVLSVLAGAGLRLVRRVAGRH
jgi:LPXTG-motif cell wall-anchored protein